jgi:hypothetical protein
MAPADYADVLITDSIDYCDGDLYRPHLAVLDLFASWGWCTYADEERGIDGEMSRVFVSVERRPICDQIAAHLLKKRQARGESLDRMLRTAEMRGWPVPALE